MVLWFVTLILLGVRWIAGAPEVLAALSPTHGVRFLLDGGWTAFLLLGSVFLVVTGGEALYADIGHFGTRPIRIVWFALVLPAVVINYLGQGAMLLQAPDGVRHTFFRLAPEWALVPLVVLATAAAVIASQAIIAGAFSLTYQAVQLGFFPRVSVQHSSATEEGQVYTPLVNWMLFMSTILLVLYFKASDALAGAYGVAVCGTMLLTTVLAFAYFRRVWGLLAAAAVAAVFMPIELTFLSANLAKVDHGGWLPLLVGAGGYLLFRTWIEGQERVGAQVTRLIEGDVPTEVLATTPLRIPGTAVYLSREQGLPRTLLINLARNHVLHECVIILSVRIEPVPHVPPVERRTLTHYVSGFLGVVAHYGYMDRPNVPAVLEDLDLDGRRISLESTTFFLARLRAIASDRPGMATWRKRLYAFMLRNAHIAAADYRIPSERVFEIGIPVEI
jgi:KUP system potassium uptake protein